MQSFEIWYIDKDGEIIKEEFRTAEDISQLFQQMLASETIPTVTTGVHITTERV